MACEVMRSDGTEEASRELVAVGEHDVEAIMSRMPIDMPRGIISGVVFVKLYRPQVVLVRLDFGGPPHRNPDDTEIACPHLHIYREGYGHKWAVPVPPEAFPRLGDLWGTLEDFMRFCNITNPPMIERGLFT